MVGDGWLVGCHEQQRGRVIGDTQYYGLYLLIKDCVDAPLTHEFGRSVVRFRGPPPSGRQSCVIVVVLQSSDICVTCIRTSLWLGGRIYYAYVLLFDKEVLIFRIPRKL